MKISGRNKISGKVVNLKNGIVTSEVEIDAGNGIKIVGVITKSSVEDMKISVGDQITALIKASSVMFITEPIRPKTPASAGGGCPRAAKSSMDSANIQGGNPPLNEVSFNKE
ncbi:MAG: TOBE domain-containing protein [Lutispora sp.]